MEYKVGDTVYMKGTVVEVDLEDEVLGLNVDFEQNGKEWVNPRGVSLCAPSDKTYEQGLQDAWELARKIVVRPSCNGMDDEEIVKAFGISYYEDVLIDLTPQEALAKLKAYEAQTIKVGDVVEFTDGTKAIVMDTDTDDSLALFTENGCVEAWIKPENVKKTGKHIDIESLLGQIREVQYDRAGKTNPRTD